MNKKLIAGCALVALVALGWRLARVGSPLQQTAELEPTAAPARPMKQPSTNPAASPKAPAQSAQPRSLADYEKTARAAFGQPQAAITTLVDLARVDTGSVESVAERVVQGPQGRCKRRAPSGACTEAVDNDLDADGYVRTVDCDDTLAHVHPGALDVPCNHVDENCDGKDDCPKDEDGDHAAADIDCDDHNARRNPLATEIPCNGVDEDCSGFDVCDRDGDGDPAPQDCNDHNPAVFNLAREVPCDGIDQNCNGVDCCAQDDDGDGRVCRLDCDDHDPAVYPGAATPHGCYMHDLDCDGRVDGVDCDD